MLALGSRRFSVTHGLHRQRPPRSLVTVIGDSVAESFEYVASARRHWSRSRRSLRHGGLPTSGGGELRVPGRATEDDARGRGRAEQSLGRVVIVNVGYTDGPRCMTSIGSCVHSRGREFVR